MKPNILSLSTLKKRKLYVFSILFLVTFCLVFLLLLEKEITFVVANKLTQNIPDLVIKVDDDIIIDDSIKESSISECLGKKRLRFGYHDIFIESKSANIQQKISLLSILDSNLYILVQQKEKQKISIDKTVYYLFTPVNQ